MSSAEQVRDLLFQQPCCDLDAHKIVDTLNWVWKEFQSQHPERACLRLRTTNLLVMCSSPADARGLPEQLQDIAELYPGRVVAVVLDKDFDGPIEGWYRIENIPGHNEQLGCELVGLHCSGNGEPLPSLLAPVWHQGLPVFLWWRGRPRYEERWFNHLLEISQRIIFDTGYPRSGVSPVEAAEPLAKVAEMIDDKYHQELAFSDLNWSRLRTWRDMIASLFDAEERRVLLDGLQQIEIVTWAPPGNEVPALHALYTAGWLARQLGYRVVQPLTSRPDSPLGGQEGLLGRNGSGSVKVRVGYNPAPSADLLYRLATVVLSGEHQGEAFRLAVERSEDSLTLERKSGSFDRQLLSNAMQLARHSNRQLLGLELETFGRDSIFEGSLRRALDLAGLVAANV